MKVTYLCVFVAKNFSLGFLLFFVQLWNAPPSVLKSEEKLNFSIWIFSYFGLKTASGKMFFLIRKSG